jgi:hypothetical protein
VLLTVRPERLVLKVKQEQVRLEQLDQLVWLESDLVDPRGQLDPPGRQVKRVVRVLLALRLEPLEKLEPLELPMEQRELLVKLVHGVRLVLALLVLLGPPENREPLGLLEKLEQLV